MKLDDPRLQEFMNTLHDENDRACAILSAAALEGVLKQLLINTLVDGIPDSIFSGSGALSTLSSKIDMSFAVGLLTKNECRDFHLIRKIRNEFAHEVDHTLSFESQSISNRVNELGCIKAFEKTGIFKGKSDTPRQRFEAAFGSLLVFLQHIRSDQIVKLLEPPEPKWT